LVVGLVGALFSPASGSAEPAAQVVLEAEISPQVVDRMGTPVATSVDPCFISASTPQIEVSIKDPSGGVLSHQWYLPGLPDTEDGTVNQDGSWSVKIRLVDSSSGQPTQVPFPTTGTYNVQVNCVSTYLPRVTKPYGELRFEVAEGGATTTTTTEVGPPATAPPADPVVKPPTFTG
jgi:hypothetical protein